MVTTLLSDEVINSTELRNRQKHWLDRAYISPVSIMSGTKQLVLINREKAKDLYLLNHYAEMIIHFCQEQSSGQNEKSSVFPWIKNLDKEEILEFHMELLSTFDEVVNNRNWRILDEMIDAWASTAEAKTNPEIKELINPKGRQREYVRLKR